MTSNLSDEQIEALKLHESTAGYKFREVDSKWILDKNTIIYLNPLRKLLNDQVYAGFIRILVHYATSFSAAHTNNCVDNLRLFLKATGSQDITENALINYRSTLTAKTEWHLGALRTFLKRWNEFGYYGVSDEVIKLLYQWRLKGVDKGDVIKRLDPIKGPLTDIELQGFNEGAVQAFEQDRISLSELALGLCISNSGRRPIQISHLRIKDVLEGKNNQGESLCLLNMPRAKQRATTFREEFKQLAITRELWVILTQHVAQVIAKVHKILGFELQEADQLELPLFPDYQVIKEVSSPKEIKNYFTGDYLHSKSIEANNVVKKIGKKCELYSERTGEPIHLNAYRFRYTTGTRAAREGFGELVIAELLDHTDTQNAGVYIKNIPDHVKALDEAVGQYLAPYAQAFAGVLVDSEKDAKRGNDINSRIRKKDQGLGNCGSYGFCGANIPIPCYTCIHFQPWVDGPHQIVLDELIEERERLKGITGDIQYAAINDRTILAVVEVIQRCEQRKEELNNV